MHPITTLSLLGALALLAATPLQSGHENPDTDWLREAKYGAFMHFLPGSDTQLRQVQDFDVPAVARQLEAVKAVVR